MRLALLQINPTAGDLEGNAALIVRAARTAKERKVDLMATPELALMGYLPRDLLMSNGFVQRSCQMLSGLAAELRDAPPMAKYARPISSLIEGKIRGAARISAEETQPHSRVSRRAGQRRSRPTELIGRDDY